jgi:hypothetical protein
LTFRLERFTITPWTSSHSCPPQRQHRSVRRLTQQSTPAGGPRHPTGKPSRKHWSVGMLVRLCFPCRAPQRQSGQLQPDRRQTSRSLMRPGTTCRGDNTLHVPTSIPTSFFPSVSQVPRSNKQTSPSPFVMTARWPTNAWSSRCGHCRTMAFGVDELKMSVELFAVHAELQPVEQLPQRQPQMQRFSQPAQTREGNPTKTGRQRGLRSVCLEGSATNCWIRRLPVEIHVQQRRARQGFAQVG